MRRNLSRTWVYLLATLAVICAITFPWDFQDHPHWFKVAWLPLVTGIIRPSDLVLNAVLYFPLGYFMPVQSRRARVAAAAGVAVLASGFLELAQVWSHVRFPSATDLMMNIVGSIAGAAVASSDVPIA